MGSGGAPSLRRGGPSSAPAPSGTDAQRREGSRAGASAALRRTRLRPPRSGLARAGCRGFCSQGPSPSPGEAGGSSERPGHPGWGKVRGGSGYPTPPLSRTSHKRETQKGPKFARARWCATPVRVAFRRPPRAAAEGRRRSSGRVGVAGMRREGETGRKRKRETGREAASRAVPTPPLQGPREREGQRLRSGVRIQGRCVFCFTPRAPSGGLSPPPSLSPRPGDTN